MMYKLAPCQVRCFKSTKSEIQFIDKKPEAFISPRSSVNCVTDLKIKQIEESFKIWMNHCKSEDNKTKCKACVFVRVKSDMIPLMKYIRRNRYSGQSLPAAMRHRMKFATRRLCRKNKNSTDKISKLKLRFNAEIMGKSGWLYLISFDRLQRESTCNFHSPCRQGLCLLIFLPHDGSLVMEECFRDAGCLISETSFGIGGCWIHRGTPRILKGRKDLLKSLLAWIGSVMRVSATVRSPCWPVIKIISILGISL